MRGPSGILGSVAALTTGEIVARVVAFAATSLLARRLGPEGFGVIGFAAALSGYFAVAVDHGLHEVGAREVARAPSKAGEIYGSVAAVRLLLAVAVLGLIAAVAWNLPKPPSTQLVVFLSGLSLVSLAVNPAWVFKGLERPVWAALGLALGQSLYAVAVVTAIDGPGDVALVPVLQFGGELVAALALAVVLFRISAPKLVLAEGWRVLRSGGYLGLARVLRAIVVSSDVVMLGFMATDREVGLYSAAYRVAFLLIAIAGSVGAAYLPSYARSAAGERAETERLVERSLGVSALIGAPLVAGTIVTASPLMTLLFGADYADGAAALRLLALSVGVLFLYVSISNVLVASHRTGLFAAIRGASAAVNVGLNLIVIPRWGIVGAASATLVAEVIVLFLGALALRRMDIRPSIRPVMVPVAAAACMTVVVVGANGWSLMAQVALGGATYVAVLAAFRHESIAVLRRTLGSIRGLPKPPA